MASVAARLSFRCPHCDKVLKTSTRPAAGKRIRCPACGEAFVPEIDDEDDATAFRERPTIKGSSAARDRYGDDRARGAESSEDEEDSSSKKKTRQPAGVNLMLLALLLLGGGGFLVLACGGLGLTAFVWPGFLRAKAEKVVAKNQGADADQAANNKANPGKFNYYPVDIGNTWHYHVNANGQIVNSSTRITGHENINGVNLVRLDSLNAPITEHFAQTEKGVFRHRLNGATVNPPFQLLPYPPNVGVKWQGEFTTNLEPGRNRYSGEIEQEEFVDVPAGRFKALRVSIRVESNGRLVQTTYWFAQDVGFVKQSMNIQGLVVLMELQRFEGKNGPLGP